VTGVLVCDPADPEWQNRADHLARLLIDLAELRQQATETYARAYLAAEGTAETRTQTARLAAADATLIAEQAAAHVAAYKFRLDVWRAALGLRGGAGDG
jgi:hypothetical protein